MARLSIVPDQPCVVPEVHALCNAEYGLSLPLEAFHDGFMRGTLPIVCTASEGSMHIVAGFALLVLHERTSPEIDGIEYSYSCFSCTNLCVRYDEAAHVIFQEFHDHVLDPHFSGPQHIHSVLVGERMQEMKHWRRSGARLVSVKEDVTVGKKYMFSFNRNLWRRKHAGLIKEEG